MRRADATELDGDLVLLLLSLVIVSYRPGFNRLETAVPAWTDVQGRAFPPVTRVRCCQRAALAGDRSTHSAEQRAPLPGVQPTTA